MFVANFWGGLIAFTDWDFTETGGQGSRRLGTEAREKTTWRKRRCDLVSIEASSQRMMMRTI